MVRLLALGALLFGAYMILDGRGTVSVSGGTAGAGFKSYSGASSPAIKGIVDAAGG